MILERERFLQILIIGLFCLTLFYPLIVISVCSLIYKNKIYPKVKIVGTDFGGQTKQEALINLKNKIEKQGLKSLLFEYQKQKWEINLTDLKFSYLPQKTTEKAFDFNRHQVFPKDILQQWHNWKKGTDLAIDYQFDQNKLKEKTASIADFINKPIIPSTIEIKTSQLKSTNLNGESSPKTIYINLGKQGRKLNREKLFKLIDKKISLLENQNINLPIESLSPKITDKQIKIAKLRAEKLLDKEVSLLFKENKWLIKDKEIINFLDFQGGFKQKKVASYSAQLAKFINRPAQNALFNFIPNDKQNSQGRVAEFKPAQDGQQLNEKRMAELIITAFTGLEKEENKSASINLPVILTKPKIQTQDANSLGIKQLIGKGESWFKGSIASRIHNIDLASKRLNGILIPPGKIFSFNQTVGEISQQTGYKQAYIIKEGRTILGDGGGVCQVSTTLFRAALNTGLPIEERKAHAYRVHYYEENYQLGVDATVFSPSTDLKFRNDTPAYVLIQSRLNIPSNELIFNLYGSWDGREAVILPSRIWDQTPPPPDLYQDDPTLPAGVIKQIDWKAWGAKVAFDWQVKRGKELLQKRTFYSYYKPWQAIFLRGTGGQ